MDLSKKLKGHLHYLHNYIECVGDLFEHKFLVFLWNCSNFHWITFIMVNPSVIYLRGDSTKNGIAIVVNSVVGRSLTLWVSAEKIYKKQMELG